MSGVLRPTLRHAQQATYARPGGPWDVPSLDALITGARRGASDRLVDGNERLRAAAVEDRVSALAGGLRAAGVRRGDAVAWQLPNWHESVLLFRACWRLGAVAVPLHRSLGGAETVSALRGIEPALVLAAPQAPALEWPEAIGVRVDWPVRTFGGLLEAQPVVASDARPADLAVALLTSGSTGAPKVVLHTQRALAYKARLMAHVHGLRHNDGVLMPAPLAHISGLLNGVLLPGVVPMKAVLMDRWDADHAVSLVAEERVSFMIGPPTFFVGMMAAASFTPRKVGSLRLVSSGGATVTPAFVASATQALGCRVKRTYGSTEAPTVTTSPSRTSVERSRLTDGKPVGEVELRISDASTGAAVPAGSVGEVWVRGPELFVGYADEAQTRAAHARGGWFRTGDLGSVDGDGWLTISGRLKDVIIRGGENVVAAEVEATVNAHPAVREAVVVGYPDAVFGERVAAVVVASKPFDVDVCRTWCASRGMTKFKIPERVIQVDELPMMAAGKADRAAIARLAREWRGD